MFMNIHICRGRGPLKSTMDVINAAKKISEAGTKLDRIAKEIADQVSVITRVLDCSRIVC